MRELEVPEENINEPVYHGEGCSTCNDTGYKGRVAHSTRSCTWGKRSRSSSCSGFSTAELKAEAIRLGMDTLRMASVKKMLEGITTPEEVVRNTAPDQS